MEAKFSSYLIVFLVLSGNLRLSLGQAGDYFDGPAKGDLDGGYNEPSGNTNLGFDNVVRRHDGYVKGETPTIPQTSFTCSAQPYNPGLYADMEANCLVYHVCFEDRQESFLCGPGTSFNQRILACDFWYNFQCQDSATFYGANSEIGKVPDNALYRPDQSGTQQRQRPPSIPSYPEPEQRPIDGYQPPVVSRPPPPPRTRPPPPRVQPPRVPQPPRGDPPRPYPPREDEPRIPQPPIGDPTRPPYPPRVEPPRIPQPPIIDPPRIPQPSDQPPSRRPPAHRPQPPPIQQEVHEVVYEPPYTSRPVFPPVISPPRVSRPPPPPPPIRRPAEPSRPQVVTRPRPVDIPSFHPDSEIKGSDYRPPRPEQPRIPQPSHPIDVGYPTHPPRPQPVRPVTRRPTPPPVFQQEHVEVEYVPPPPPPPPRQPPSRPSYVPPPPPPPIEQEVILPEYVRPPAPSGPSSSFVPPPRPPVQRPEVSPPSAPSIPTPQQRRPPPTPIRPVPTRPRQPPQRQRPVFPPSSDHPNANVKGGPGYRQPPPAQLPSYEPTRITHRPSSSVISTGIQRPPPQRIQPPVVVRPPPPPAVKQPEASVSTAGIKRPPASSQTIETSYKPPRIPQTRPQPAIRDHPDAGIKGGYRQPPPPRRVVAPATSITAVRRPQCSGDGSYGCPRPQPPSAPSTSIKTKRPSTSHQVYEPKPEPAPSRTKLPSSQTTSQVFRPAPIDHPDASIKGGPRIRQNRPQVQPIRVQPSSPSISHHQRIVPDDYPSGGEYQSSHDTPYNSRGDGGQVHQEIIIHEQPYEPQRRPSTITQHRQTIHDSTPNKRPSSSQQNVHGKPGLQDYDAGSSYTRGPETYPKPEFSQQSRPVSTPSRSSTIVKQTPASQNRIAPQRQRPSGSYPEPSSPSQSGVRPQDEYNVDRVPGHQPPNRPQVFPHRDNPDHPNESIKGTSAYRPPPPANFQASASEVEQQIVEQVEQTPEIVQSSKFGDSGSEE